MQKSSRIVKSRKKNNSNNKKRLYNVDVKNLNQLKAAKYELIIKK